MLFARHDTGMMDNLVPCRLWESGIWIFFLYLAMAKVPQLCSLVRVGRFQDPRDSWDGSWVAGLEPAQLLPACLRMCVCGEGVPSQMCWVPLSLFC